MQTEAIPTRPLVRPSGDGERLWFTTNLITIKARAEDSGGRFGLIEAVVPPGSGPPLHVHSREEESFWVLAGELTIRVGEEELRCGPGDFASLPRGVPHTFVVEGERPARFLNLITPGGMEDYFARAGRPAEGEGLPPLAPPDVELLDRVGVEFGLEIVGPPLRPRG